MTGTLMNIIFLLFTIFVSCNGQEPKFSCYGEKPFKTKDLTCSDFSEICVKQGDAECESFQQICSQCPPLNSTVKALLNHLKLSRDVLGMNLAIVNKKVDQVENKMETKQNNLEKLLNHTIGICLAIIIFVVISWLILIFLLMMEIRLKDFRKRRGNKHYRNETNKESENQTNEYELLMTNRNDTQDLKLQNKLDEFLIKVKDILDPKSNLDESIIKMNDLLVKTNSKFDSFLDKHEWTEWFVEVEPIQNEEDAVKKAEEYIKHHPGLEFTGKWSTTKPIVLSAVTMKSLGKTNVNVERIIDEQDATRKAKAFVTKYPYLAWTGKWNTTVTNTISTIEVECINNKHQWTEWIVEDDPKKTDHFMNVHPGVEFIGKWSTKEQMWISAITVKSTGKKNIEVGLISDMQDAFTKANAFVSRFPYLSWTGKWNTTTPNEMSVIEVECINNKEGGTEWIVKVEPWTIENFKINHPGLEFTGKWSTTKSTSMSVICVKSLGKTNVEIGPIYNQQDAVVKSKAFEARFPYLRWTGQWITTVPGKMSVIEVECIKDPNQCEK